jgi:glycosyltransferase involved in cell wall biosynthesis
LDTDITSDAVNSTGRIIYDGLNLTLGQGTGIATYTRMLMRIARKLGYDVGVVYATAFTPDKNPLLGEILFFDQMRAPQQLGTKRTPTRMLNTVVDQFRYHFTVKPLALRLGEAVIDEQFADTLPEQDRAFVARNLFKNANSFFNRTSRFVNLSFDSRPDIFHCTYPVPLRVCSARNIYTIHDLIPLRLPFVTLESKRRTFKLLKYIVRTADHIVTVSENSKRDIVELLGVDEGRVTNTYQAVVLPKKYIERPEAAVANYIDGLYGLEMRGYLLFFGALEPKKNVGRLIDAFLASGVDLPLVLVTARGWHNADVVHRLDELSRKGGGGTKVRCLDYVGLSTLITLIRGARAVVFPSLYEGFGLPVLEAMMLGTPVVTSAKGALGEIAGDAALLVDPYDVDDIARGITTIVNDADLRSELNRRGTAQAAKFSVERYQERVQSLYASLT